MKKELKEAIKDLDFPSTIKYLVDKGYCDNDLTPLKCTNCDSHNLERTNIMYDNYHLVEYQIKCKDCNEILGTWSYGGWSL